MKTFKKIATFVVLFTMAAHGVMAQSAYWVILTDKAGTTFDPYAYFDAKAIERYNACGADLYDVSNFPLNGGYVNGVEALATDTIGSLRWLNAMAVMATPDQIAAIEALPYVARVVEGGMAVSECAGYSDYSDDSENSDKFTLSDQLVRMQGERFRAKGIDGRGVRVAVFDGGFPRVNTHDAFKHLRDEGRILKTWNFCNRCENVYGWNSHGTMTLSCIAGREGDTDLGLATGAEFLLARTEIDLEPFKEEVWWMQAVEWADKNGAQVISSSLGYGIGRHYTKDMDGTSFVAKAGNMAARKGILVCNSAGNEGTDRQWRTITTPSDADSVLCVGGIEHSLTEYSHISFSSYGPSADGRQKPNVVAFGHARTANVTSNSAYHYVDGTSFSCPLVAGFAACAIQAMPGKSVMEMFHEIERSGDLYPYCDYAFGYGVPQASYFVSEKPAKPSKPTFRFVEQDDSVKVVPTGVVAGKTMFYRFINPDGQLDNYGNIVIEYLADTMNITFDKASVYNRTLEVNLDGYTASYRLPEAEQSKYANSVFWYSPDIDPKAVANQGLSRNGASANKTSNWGSQSKYRYDLFIQYGVTPNTMGDEMTVVYSDAFRVGARLLRSFSKSYCLGIGLECGESNVNFPLDRVNAIDNITSTTLLTGTERKRLVLNEWSLEIFQRVRLVPGGHLSGRGIYWDLGLFGSYISNSYTVTWNHTAPTLYSVETHTFGNLNDLANHRWNYGVVTRFGYSIMAVYARYRLNTLIGKGDNDLILPRLEVGLQMYF